MNELAVPELSLVCPVGASRSGRSAFAKQHVGQFEVLPTHDCRGLVNDDVNVGAAGNAAFDVLHSIAAGRLDAGRLTVVDATDVQPESAAS